jgi:integrase
VSGKRATTVGKEKGYLKRWSAKLGHLRLNKIRPHHLSRTLTELAGEGHSARSVNLYLISIRHVLKAALRDGHIKPPLPFEGLGWQRVDQKARQLFSPEDVDHICEAALAVSKNGRQFADYLRFMQFSVARRNEALAVRWQDVDFTRGHVTIGAEGDSKNREARHVDFNPRLEAYLKVMRSRRQPDSKWLFPSPQRGDEDTAARTFMESLRLTRNAAGCICQDCERTTFGADAAKRLRLRARRKAREGSARKAAKIWLARPAPLFCQLRRHVRRGLYDHCPMGWPQGRRRKTLLSP